jgi:hypothetical protein
MVLGWLFDDNGHEADRFRQQWFLVVVAILFSMFTYSLDGTIVADLVPSIVNEFDSVPLLPWLSVG